MPFEILIDGYNLIRQSPSLSRIDAQDLERGREALVEQLAAYRHIRGHRITVVFDGWDSFNLSSTKTNKQGITVIFTRRGESADEWIKERIKKLRDGTVVTSDREIREYAEQAGIPTISSPEFEQRMEEAVFGDLTGIEPEEIDEDDEDQAVKKGPSRRLSKKEKKRQAFWKRL